MLIIDKFCLAFAEFAENSKSTSSASIESPSPLRKPYFSKDRFTLDEELSFPTHCAHRIASKMFISLILSATEALSLIQESGYLTNDFRYLILKFRIIPASNG